MWPGLHELKTLSKQMKMSEDLVLPAEKSRQLSTPPLTVAENGFGRNGSIKPRKITAVNPLHPSMLMPEVVH